MARAAVRGLEGHLRDASHVDAGGRKGRARAGAAAQSFVGDRDAGHAARALDADAAARPTRSFTIEFDFIDHQLVIRASDGATRTLALGRKRSPTSTAR